MPRPGPRRPMLFFRDDDETLTALDRLAAHEHVTRSEIIRQLIREALAARAR